MTASKRTYVLDTNVLMHHPTSPIRFEEHDIVLPMVVLEELDAAKKGTSEVARNVRQVSRFLNELIQANGDGALDDGIALLRPHDLRLGGSGEYGRLYFQASGNGVASAQRRAPDNQIIDAALALRERLPGQELVLVSKDINLRIKASIYGIPAEDYENDRALDDFSLLFTGLTELQPDFWERHQDNLRSWTDRGQTFYEVDLTDDEDWQPNQFLYFPGDEDLELRVAERNGERIVLQMLDDYRQGS